jgi:hypothetical protein
VDREYKHDLTAVPYALPEGQEYPKSMWDKVKGVKGPAFEAGIGRNQVWFTWLCAWEGEYLSSLRAGDDEATKKAARQVERWAEMKFYRTVVDDPSGAWRRNVLVPLRAGSGSGVRQEFDSMCLNYPTVRRQQ